MPIFGGTGAVQRRGLNIPYGALDIWKAARALHATDRPEVVIMGDSTWWGQTVSTEGGTAGYSATNYSPVAQLRALAAAAGYTDGGPGLVGLFDHKNQLGIAVDPVNRGYTAGQSGAGFTLLLQYSPALSSTQTITYRPQTSQARIWALKSGDSGSFTYSVNGGAAVTVTPGTAGGWLGTVITGMTAGADNTIVFTNVSGTNRIDVEFLNATGLVFHKQCVPGGQATDFVVAPDETASTLLTQAILGLNQTGQTTTAAEGTHPAARKVRLGIWTLGINDINGLGAGVAPRHDDTYLNAVNQFIQGVRIAGGDPVICAPHWKVNQTGYNFSKAGALMMADLAALAAAEGCAFVDLNEALGGPLGKWSASLYSTQDPHLKAAGYVILGTYLWNNIINA